MNIVPQSPMCVLGCHTPALLSHSLLRLLGRLYWDIWLIMACWMIEIWYQSANWNKMQGLKWPWCLSPWHLAMLHVSLISHHIPLYISRNPWHWVKSQLIGGQCWNLVPTSLLELDDRTQMNIVSVPHVCGCMPCPCIVITFHCNISRKSLQGHMIHNGLLDDRNLISIS